MEEYIPRKEAIIAVCSARLPDVGKDGIPIANGKRSVSDCVRRIKAIPASDVRPVVRGRWIKYAPHNSDMMTCSECEKYWILDGDQYDYHFCPNCGARMEEQT